jgi:hypothetical protein
MFVRALLLVCTLASAYYAYVGYVEQGSGAPERKMEDEARAQLIADVAQVFDVPPDEVPRIATIKSTETLSGNAFFADAVAGDKLLVYCVSGRTVLFRPSTRSVINSLMSPLDGVCPQK